MGMNPWVSSEIAVARAADLQRAAARAHLRAEARHAEVGDRARPEHRPVRRVVARKVGELLIATGARLVGPETPRRKLRGA